MAALELAALEPDLPAGIVAIDSPLVPSEELAERLRETAERFRSPDWRPAHRAFLEQALFIPADDPRRKEKILQDMTSAPDHVTRECFEAILAADTVTAASRCRVPFLYISAAVPLADLPRLRRLCPHVVTAQTACAGHFAQLEVPDQVNAMIERFLVAEVARSR
jgi:pimeloyl-ACP methyl ester carboxylesterase